MELPPPALGLVAPAAELQLPGGEPRAGVNGEATEANADDARAPLSERGPAAN
jgi:hypothetical protein